MPRRKHLQMPPFLRDPALLHFYIDWIYKRKLSLQLSNECQVESCNGKMRLILAPGSTKLQIVGSHCPTKAEALRSIDSPSPPPRPYTAKRSDTVCRSLSFRNPPSTKQTQFTTRYPLYGILHTLMHGLARPPESGWRTA
ncbi:hypothetical protein NW760_006576 [Fusarium oxysporum]|nr:hypothetical protein NW769_006861 [Fusarium oxysporum]KAJ4231773.1 hypothetical protein NW760_006576 [Fusarium oxysporum]